MPKRRRWKPIKGTASRIYEPKERLLLGGLDLPFRVIFGLKSLLLPARPALLDPAAIAEVLVLRLDRIGDLIMSLPALADLRAALPGARIRLGVGQWSRELAESAPVDEVLLLSAPWVGRKDEGAESWTSLVRKALALRRDRLDLAIDLQGDVRASVLMWLSGARARIGYANTGGAYLLTHVVGLDETVSWVEQNRKAVAAFLPKGGASFQSPLTERDRDFQQRLFQSLAMESRRPLVGIHPSGGRGVKQWDVRRWSAVAARLQREFGATVFLTGAAADRPLARSLMEGLPEKAMDLTGRLQLRETMAVISALDLFLSPDTGTMHMACALGTPSLSVFGPSDPKRYHSSQLSPAQSRHIVVRHDLWCSPCNLIRRPPKECRGPEPPECLRLVTVEEVFEGAARLLREEGHYSPRSQP